MKRKSPPPESNDPAAKSVIVKPVIVTPAVGENAIVSPELLAEAKRTAEGSDHTDLSRLFDSAQAAPMAKCYVCGGDATPNPTEQLCWVCRRLKISAWRDVESQVPVQE